MASESKVSSGIVEPNEKSQHVDHVDIHTSEVLVNPDLMSDAVEGENREHEENMWASVKAHPWACLWAFTMCFTIVSRFSRILFAVPRSQIAQTCLLQTEQHLISIRSWSRSTCF